MKETLYAAHPSPLERLLVDRFICNWIVVTHAEWVAADRAEHVASDDAFTKWLDRSQRRFMSAARDLATWLWANPVHADEIKDFCQSYLGKNYFLKIDVVKIYQGISNTDATNIYPSGEVLHRKASSVSHDAEMFIAEIGRQAIADNQDWKLSLLRRGTELLVHKVETKKLKFK
jgi:hypothetical protein